MVELELIDVILDLEKKYIWTHVRIPYKRKLNEIWAVDKAISQVLSILFGDFHARNFIIFQHCLWIDDVDKSIFDVFCHCKSRVLHLDDGPITEAETSLLIYENIIEYIDFCVWERDSCVFRIIIELLSIF